MSDDMYFDLDEMKDSLKEISISISSISMHLSQVVLEIRDHKNDSVATLSTTNSRLASISDILSVIVKDIRDKSKAKEVLDAMGVISKALEEKKVTGGFITNSSNYTSSKKRLGLL